MKRKFTILLFSLLLAVGWTNDALAQSATYKAADLAGWTYTWTDAQGNPQESPYVVLNSKGEYEAPQITDAYQIYGFLRAVYMDKRLPGPWQSAYKADGVTREDDIYYGGCGNGWDIPYVVSTDPLGDITINFASGNADFRSITVNGNNGSTSWSFAANGTNLPQGWSTTKSLSEEDDYSNSCYLSQGGTITIPASLLNGSTSAQVVINAKTYNSQYSSCAVTVNGQTTTITNYSTWSNYTWSLPYSSSSNHPTDTYKPTNEGYTAIIVSLQNDTYKPTEPSNYGGSMAYTSSSEVIEYLSRNIKYVKLLTDGLRITGSNPGTVFNCDGTYNKFFFLGKGKARQKGQEVLDRINANTYPAYAGECVAFWPLFEEFSPSTPEVGVGITDFFDKMNEGNVYSVVHDCAGVIQNTHEFSLSGPTGTTDYPFTGMNFFIPDYRLKYWVGKDSLQTGGPYYDVDGRDMNAMWKIDGSSLRSVSPYYANFCQYNPEYAPKVGIYKITLEATLSQISDSHQPGNQNFVVTLTWVSSLDQLSGLTDVPQTYTVYYYDPETGERKYVVAEGITDGKTGLTTVSYPAEQKEHGYIIDHIVMGQPDNNDHHSFVAWSNHSAVTIPGWDDFVGLVLDHHESDFIIQQNSRDNWYRNFLAMVNEDKFNGLTIDQIRGGMNTFTLYRSEYKESNDSWSANQPIATITFDQISNDNKQVHYTINYVSTQDILTYNTSPANKYQRSTMGVPDQGWVRVKGNGDLVIWPNNYHVNIKSIVIKNNGTELYSWNASSANVDTENPNLPNGWETSPGSKMMPYIMSTTGEKVCYMEGGGYIYIPNMIGNYANLTIEIVAFTDGANVGRIEVNDRSQNLTNSAATYTWGIEDLDHPISPLAAPRHDNEGNNSSKSNMSKDFSINSNKR